jgi:hypothetical protein
MISSPHPLSSEYTMTLRSAVLIACIALSTTLTPHAPLFAQAACTPLNTDIPVRSTLASAGFFANLRKASNSISYLMDQLITESESRASELSHRESACKRSCTDAVLAVVFSSSPHMTMPDYDESSTCQQLYTSTQKSPITYSGRSFDSQEEAEEWYDDLTQGDGNDGEDLYARCPGKCSPSYSSVSYKRAGKFIVSTSIICGHARDKDDNQYRLSAALRWICL